MGSRGNNSQEDNTKKESSSCNKSKEEGSTTISGKFLEIPNLKEFSYGDLKVATKNFKSDALLGEGGFGKVYKGWLNAETLTPAKAGSGMIVAIKKLNSDSVQGVQEWQFKLSCVLFWLGNPKPLSWDTRLKITIDAARGLAFLHSSEKQIIYRDFKASNILLDGNYNAKISDFGLAKFGPSGENSHVTTRIMGTYGYAAPEYIATGHLYVKSDVYGFGVVLLEMLTGLKALDIKRPMEKQNLVEWMKPSLTDKRKLKGNIVDYRLEGQYSSKAAFEIAQLILKCLESDPKKRPSMEDVLGTLEGINAIKDKRRISKNHCTKSATM
ncbi:hypothetical protein TSUD_223630 [Trifolium subterraneum]|uniref:Protein kinase domain-containing protein n=1 Tax=Trifolium subterraneum TaxID=3900 RepID=A0A2Z6NJ98_TRISU|nr:hypothetical protein TSUD_223630 [Trifolium subterraneum]